MQQILITGSGGFVGSHLIPHLYQADYPLKLLCRQSSVTPVVGEQSADGSPDISVSLCNYENPDSFSPALEGVDVVVHLAGLAHLSVRGAEGKTALQQVNVELTCNLAEQAAEAGVKRFIYMSSVKAQSERSLPGQPLTETDTPQPEDAYGQSKLDAERALISVCQQQGMEYVIIRSPLVYGPGVKANFRALFNWVAAGRPLPLGAVHNHRSLVSVDNLVDFIRCCIGHPQAANQLFLVSDGSSLSIVDMVRRIQAVTGRPCWLPAVPVTWLKVGAGLLGQGSAFERLCGDLELDISKSEQLLGWQPRVGMTDTLQNMWAEDRQMENNH